MEIACEKWWQDRLRGIDYAPPWNRYRKNKLKSFSCSLLHSNQYIPKTTSIIKPIINEEHNNEEDFLGEIELFEE